jgi:hypothetical protein
MYLMASLFVIGFICNACIKAVNSKYHMTADKAGKVGDSALSPSTAKA